MHIVYVSREYVPSLRGGGIASYVKDMAQGMVNIGHEVTVICASDDTSNHDEYIDEFGVRVIKLEGGDFVIPSVEGNSIIKKLRSVYRFHSYRRKIRETILSLNKIDVIEVPEFGAEGFYLMNINIPVVVRLHTPSFLDRSNLKKKKFSLCKLHDWWCALQEEKIIKKAKYITSCSENLKEWSIKYFNIETNTIKVIYNPIFVTDWKGTRVQKKNNYINIIFAGTVCEEKGVEDLIKACIILVSRGKKIYLNIAGKMGEYGNSLKEKYKDLTWCTFLGKLERTDLKQYYLSNEIACFPSWWEAFGIICIEAMATGCLVIGSSEGGMCEIIKNKYNGFLIKPKNHMILANLIEEIDSLNSIEKEKISKNAVDDIYKNFDIKNILNQTLNYYKNIITTDKQ